MAKRRENKAPNASSKRLNNDLRNQKKEAVLGTAKKRGFSTQLILAVTALTVAVVVAVIFTFQDGNDHATAVAGSGAGTVSENTISYPVSTFDDGQARHYAFEEGGKTIRYFIIKSSDGVIRAAFDACDVCWAAGKGYVQDGDSMVCRNCERRFASKLVNEVKGGCNPAPLKRRVEGDRLVITKADILSGAGYFDFKGRANG